MNVTQIEWISKEEAAERLELSPRRILELAKQGKLKSSRIVSTATGKPVVVIHAGSVERYRDKLSDPLIGGDAACEPHAEDAARDSHANGAARGPHAKAIAGTRLTERAIGEMLAAVSHAVRTRYALWLTVDEAADYAGLPKRFLRDMVLTGQLEVLEVGRCRGGRWRLSRRDLEAIHGQKRINSGTPIPD